MENNMKAMREALVWLSKTGHRTPEGGWMCITLKQIQKDGKPYPVEVPPYAEDVINAALAKPPRNCDVGTADEQYKRHTQWCNKMKDYSCAATMCRRCFAKWAQMPYEEEGDKDEQK